VPNQLRSTYLANKAGVARVINEFVKACYGRAASKAQPDRSRELADLNKRIKTTVALLSDSDLADVANKPAPQFDRPRAPPRLGPRTGR